MCNKNLTIAVNYLLFQQKRYVSFRLYPATRAIFHQSENHHHQANMVSEQWSRDPAEVSDYLWNDLSLSP